MKVPRHAIPIVSSAIPDPAAETPSTFSSTVERREASADPKPVTFGAPPIQVNAKILATPTKHAFTKCGVINERLLPIVIDNEFPPAEAEHLKNPNWSTIAAANSDSTTITSPSTRIVGHPPNRAYQQVAYSTYARKKRCQLFFPYFPSAFLLEYAFYVLHE
jgi:hypothetical protein